MVKAIRLVTGAAGEAVQDVSGCYEDYQAELVQLFTKVLQVMQSEPSEHAQRREIEGLIVEFAGQISAKREAPE